MEQFILTLRCADRPGIVRALADGIVAAEGNILESAQYADGVTGLFTIRIRFEAPEGSGDAARAAIAERVSGFDCVLTLRPISQRPRALIMVSKFDHCLVDLLYRWQRGELPIEIPLVVSNHNDLREIVERAGISFAHLPVTAGTKAVAEAQLLELVDANQIDFVVLARYMQVLSDDLCRTLSGRVINIHHSFLPGFKGAKPYHQAYERGVKLIGATAHYVTADLDEGPIIEQDVVRVTHAQTAEELATMGRDVERVVLSRAVKLHAEDRAILVGHRTVVFG
ncbi:MAG: formyltetrahydrofolate deformylase [Actinobacteria bacterium]|nr:formyltetrahydrofolate deformylase [Actinomycetota bacterium]